MTVVRQSSFVPRMPVEEGIELIGVRLPFEGGPDDDGDFFIDDGFPLEDLPPLCELNHDVAELACNREEDVRRDTMYTGPNVALIKAKLSPSSIQRGRALFSGGLRI